MKKVIRITVIFLCIVFIGTIGFKTWSVKLVADGQNLSGLYVDFVL